MTVEERIHEMIEHLQEVVADCRANKDGVAATPHEIRIDTLRQALGEIPYK